MKHKVFVALVKVARKFEHYLDVEDFDHILDYSLINFINLETEGAHLNVVELEELVLDF